MEFRRMISSDRPMIETFYQDMGPVSSLFFNRDWNREHTMDQFDHPDNGREDYVMVENGRILGQIILWDCDSTIPSLGIAVRDDCQGRHIGTFMLEKTVENIRNRNKGGLLLTTSPKNYRAQKLYEKIGFSRIGLTTSPTFVEFVYLLKFRNENNT